jgi:hypothetical protein
MNYFEDPSCSILLLITYLFLVSYKPSYVQLAF